jgi:sulfoxide reductase heme-binding subunit YedZ
MNRKALIISKIVVWIGALAPLAMVVYEAITNTLGPDPSAAIADDTGQTTLWMLAILLAITPVRRLIPRLNWLIKFRRLIGLFVFFYATVHLSAYVGLYAGFDVHVMLTDVTKRRFIIVGAIAWLLMLPLALTSTTWAIRKMGGRNWNRLHKLVYLTAIAADIHYWWKVKTGVLSPAPYTLVLTILLLARPALWWAHRRKMSRAVTPVVSS